MFQLVFYCLMVIMLSLTPSALLFIQLLILNRAFAGPSIVDRWNVLKSKGDSVLLTCNISNKSITMIQWTKDTFYFIYSTISNQTYSNFSSHKLRIDTNIPTTLNIISAQHEDGGLYSCNITGEEGIETILWNLTVSDNQNETSLLNYFTFTLPPAVGLLLCCTAIVVCLHRKLGTSKEDQRPVQNLSLSQSERQDVPTQLQGTDQWKSKRHRRDYKEKLNSVYGHL